MAHIFQTCIVFPMSPEFHQLSEKVAQLAALTQSLRRENADLRLNVSTLTNQNTELLQRVEQAHLRVSAVLEQLPVTQSGSPDTSSIDEEETA
jgi:cell division protein ZapB